MKIRTVESLCGGSDCSKTLGHERLLSAFLAVLVMAAICFSASCSSAPEENLVVLKRTGLPVVYYRVMVNAGSALDPDDKAGLANFTANLLDKGTRTRSRSEIQDQLGQIGAEISVSVDKEVVVISGRTLSENSEAFYDIFREILTAPQFPEEEIAKGISDQLDQIRRIREDDERLSLAVFENAVFADHRYGHAIQGTEEAVKSFTQRDALDFYRTNYVRGNILAGIGGDVSDAMVERFGSDLNSLPSGNIKRSNVKVKLPESMQIILVEKENRAQSHIRIGHVLDDNRTSPQYFPMRVLGCYLGQHREMFGRLFKTVRSERGLAYGAYAYIEHFRPLGWSKLMDNGIVRSNQYFHMWTYPKEVNFEFCIKLMMSEMSKLVDSPMTAEDIDRTKDYVSNNFAFMMETPDRQLGMRLDEKWYGLPDFVDGYKSKIKRLPRTELQTVAIDNLHPDKVLVVAVVSNGELSKQELLSPETALELPSGAEEGNLKGVNDEIRALNLKLTPDNIKIVKASELLK